MSRPRKLWLVIGGVVLACLATWAIRSRANEGLKQLKRYRTITVFDVKAEKGQSLATLTSARIDQKSTRIICREVTYHKGPLFWRGSFLGVVELDNGDTKRIAISRYGGFFQVLGEKGHYQTEGKSRAELDENMSRIIRQHFIPRRHTRGSN